MESLLILILIIVLIVFLVKQSGSTQKPTPPSAHINHLIGEIIELKNEIKNLKTEININADKLTKQIENLPLAHRRYQPNSETNVTPVNEEVTPIPPAQEIITEQPIAAEPFILNPETQPVTNEEKENIEPTPQPTISAEVYDIHGPTPPFIASTAQSIPNKQAQPIPANQETWTDTWLRNNPDLEKFIGENLINKIGIAVLVLGIAFFVKYAIDKDWINETGRVCIGLGCGAILVGLAHFLHKNYRSFSSVLAGGGIAIFYFTIAFGFHQYHLMTQTAAFVMMVVITVFAIALSVLYNRLELAIIATVGGFLAPFLVSNGSGNYVALFTYLVILDVGILSLAYFKRWPAINIIALFFTEIIYGSWLVAVLNAPALHFSYRVALLFASVFYFIFLGMNMIYQVKNKAHFKAFDFIILLLISSSYFAAGISLLHSWNNGAYQGLFTLALGLVNLALAYYVYKKGKADRNLLFLLIGITLTFITLTIPIQLHGHAITLFWSAEFVLLYWLSEYSGIRVFKYSSLLVCLLTLISLTMDWQHAAQVSTGKLLVIYNNLQGIVTNVVAIAAFVCWFALLRKNEEGETAGFSNLLMAKVALIAAVALLYITCIFGVNLHYQECADYAIPNVYHRMITEIFALAFIILVQRKKELVAPLSQFAALAVCFVVFVFSTDIITELRDNILQGTTARIHFYAHWADSLLLVIIFYMTIQGIRSRHNLSQNGIKVLSIIITVMALTFVSLEMLHIYVVACYRKNNIVLLNSQYGKAGLTVIWAICSFALMWLGMKHREKTLRIISLVLFSIVLLKLFLIDISEISEGGKILAFILLGVLLLTVSFMYQKVKKIIIDDKKE